MKKIGRYFIFSFLAVFVAVFFLGLEFALAEAADKDVFKWRLQAVGPRGCTETNVIVRFADQVREASGGRLDITVYGADEIVPTFETFDALSRGLLEMHCNDPSYWMGKTNNCSGIISFPFLFPTPVDQKVFLENKGALEILREVYAKQNIYLVNQFRVGNGTIWTKFPFTSLKDFEGKKIRAHGIWSDALNRVGVSAITMPGGEVYEAMERGVVDGLISANPAWCFDYGFHEVSKFVSPSQAINIANLEFAVNMDAWNSLPNDLKAILSLCARESEYHMVAENHDVDSIKLAIAKEKWGIKETEFDAESMATFRAAMMKAVDEYSAKDETFARLGVILRDFLNVITK